jgi:hypothetical protein
MVKIITTFSSETDFISFVKPSPKPSAKFLPIKFLKSFEGEAIPKRFLNQFVTLLQKLPILSLIHYILSPIPFQRPSTKFLPTLVKLLPQLLILLQIAFQTLVTQPPALLARFVNQVDILFQMSPNHFVILGHVSLAHEETFSQVCFSHAVICGQNLIASAVSAAARRTARVTGHAAIAAAVRAWIAVIPV